jgi:hypothetical protein
MTFHLTPQQRVANAKKAAATRKLRGEKAFGGKHHHGPLGHSVHHKAYTHAAHHASPHTSPAQRTASAKKAALTRHAHKVAH